MAGTCWRRMAVGPLPDGWNRGDKEGQFEASGFAVGGRIPATVRVFEPLGANPDYLLRRFGAQIDGPLGRPTVQSLPDSLADGVSIVAFDEAHDETLSARIDLVRRAWDLDIVVSARTTEIAVVEQLFSVMLDLLATVQPTQISGDEQ
ncbi:MAG TPA: hypothetical protein VEX88_11835 [Glaciibacter sp.]|nr:hypothetical protein [Glaciibacter sp.]